MGVNGVDSSASLEISLDFSASFKISLDFSASSEISLDFSASSEISLDFSASSEISLDFPEAIVGLPLSSFLVPSFGLEPFRLSSRGEATIVETVSLVR